MEQEHVEQLLAEEILCAQLILMVVVQVYQELVIRKLVGYGNLLALRGGVVNYVVSVLLLEQQQGLDHAQLNLLVRHAHLLELVIGVGIILQERLVGPCSANLHNLKIIQELEIDLKTSFLFY